MGMATSGALKRKENVSFLIVAQNCTKDKHEKKHRRKIGCMEVNICESVINVCSKLVEK